MLSQFLMLKPILAFAIVNSPLHIPDVPDIEHLTKTSTTSTSNITHPPTYEHLCGNLLTKTEEKTKLFPYKKYLISLIKIVNSNCQLGRPKLMQIFIFWLEEYVICLYDEFKLE